jgi:uncharacterized protein (DUF924 family)
MIQSADNKNWINNTLNYWFHEVAPSVWFNSNATTDTEISLRFSKSYRQMRDSRPDICTTSARAALAAIIILDQFPRNMFRGSPETFATDAIALDLAETAIKSGLDRQLPASQRAFLYMPFQHSENKAVQARSVQLFASLGDDSSLDFARRHKEIIDRFGRFPHRNAVLGRPSTPGETAFLKEPGSSF